MKTTYYNAQFSPNIFSKNGINSSYFYTKTWDQLSIKKEQNAQIQIHKHADIKTHKINTNTYKYKNTNTET